MFGDYNGFITIAQNYTPWVSPAHWMMFQTHLQLFNFYWKQRKIEEASQFLHHAKSNAEVRRRRRE